MKPRISKLIILFFILMFVSSNFGQRANQNEHSYIKFELLSMHIMSDEELLRKAPDNIGPDLLVKFRLSNIGKGAIYFFTNFKNSFVPFGYNITQTSNGNTWLIDASGKNSLKSPGIQRPDVGSWMLLEDGSAIEWEELESSSPQEEIHIRSIFIKSGQSNLPREIFSDAYKVRSK